MTETRNPESNRSPRRLTQETGPIIVDGPVEKALRRRLESGRKNLVPFLTAGFPDHTSFMNLMRAAQEIGCDAIEIGIPFSDPIADGPSIQFSNQQVLRRGMNVAKALELIARTRMEIPILCMGYLNPILAFGLRKFVNDAKSAGVSGIIIPDLPPELLIDPNDLNLGFLRQSLETVLMVAPTTTKQRMATIGNATRGFLYAVTVTGTTGACKSLPSNLASFMRTAGDATTSPVLAGFGISNPKNARAIARHCDGVIVGSALIEQMRAAPARSAVKRASKLLKRLRDCL